MNADSFESELKQETQDLIVKDPKTQFYSLLPNEEEYLVEFTELPQADVRKDAAVSVWNDNKKRIQASYASSSEESDDSDDDPMCASMTKRTQNEDFERVRRFTLSLAHCIPLIAGFHVVYLKPDADACCFPPWSKHMKPFREAFSLVEIPGAKSVTKFAPKGLLDHLEAQKQGHAYYSLTLEYLRRLYKHYYVRNVHHEAMYNMNTKEQKIALSEKQKKQKWLFDSVKARLTTAEAKVKDLETTKRKLEQVVSCLFLHVLITHQKLVSLTGGPRDICFKLNSSRAIWHTH